MSTTIDQQVVEMRFDNQHFEKNVQTSMSTIDKLKAKLNLTGASKGLENINAAAKNNNMGVLGNGVEAVRVKFSALQIMGVTALTNITNSAVNAGKRITKALTIDPVKTGFQEYETQMNAVQTILANTQSKGTTIEDVNAALDELNTYADKTIYNFTEMTRNIGTFTAAGIDLDKSTMAIKGIANLAAVSGSTSQQASTAMYQLSQALSSGTVKLQDWNSVVNAGMGGQLFQDALKRTATQMGVNVDAMIEKYGSFRESLTRGEWVTAEVLTETLSQLAGAYSKADLMAQGYSESQAEEIVKLSETANDAATKVKTYTQLIDTVKESIQSGWTQTWEYIVGDFEEAKEMFTKISDAIGTIVEKISDSRNTIIGGAFTSKWEKLNEKIEKAGLSTNKFTNNLKEILGDKSVEKLEKKYGSLKKAIDAGAVPVKKITKALKQLLGMEGKAADATDKVTGSIEDFNKIVSKVINGDLGNGQKRIKALTEAGYDYATVQNKVNEILGDSTRHATKLKEGQDGVANSQAAQVESLLALTDAKLKDLGYTEEQIKALRELGDAAEGTGKSFEELLTEMDKPSGRQLLLESFAHLWEQFKKIAESIGQAWSNVFGESNGDDKANSLYNLIEKFNALTTSMTFSGDTATNFQKILTGVFSALDLSWSLASVSFMGFLKILNAVLNLFDTDLGTVLGQIADYITKFNKWVETDTIFGSATKWDDIATIIVTIGESIMSCVDAFLQLEKVQAIVENLKAKLRELFGTDTFSGFLDLFTLDSITAKISDIFSSIKDYITKGKDVENLGMYIIEGLIKGMTHVVSGLFDAVVMAVDIIITTFKTLFDINSPSRVMMTLGGFIIAGLIAGMLSKGGEMSTFLQNFGTTMIDGFKFMLDRVKAFVSDIDFGKIVAIGLSAGLIVVVKKLADALELFGNPLEALAGILEGLKKGVEDISSAMSGAIKLRARAAAFKNLAIGIAILAGALWILAQLEWKDIGKGVAAIAALALILIGLSIACEKLNAVGEFGLNWVSITGIGLAILAIAGALKMVSTINPDQMRSALEGIIVIILSIIGVMSAMAKLTKGAGNVDFKHIGKIFTRLAVAMLLMVAVIKLAGILSAGDILKGAAIMTLMAVFFRAFLTAAQGLIGINDKTLAQIRKISTRLGWALLLMIGVIKVASMLSWREIGKGTVVILGITAFFAGVLYLLKMLPTSADMIAKIDAIGGMILSISAAMILMSIALKVASGLTMKEIGKGLAAIAGVGAIMAALVAVSKLSGKHAQKAGLMLIEFAAAMLLMTAVIIILKELPSDGILKALGIMAGVALIFAGLIAVTYFAQYADKVKGILITLVVALGILSVAIIAMSFLDKDKVATAGAALAGVIAAFGVLIWAVTNLVPSKNGYGKVIGTIILLTVVTAALGGIILLLSNMDPTKGMAAATSLGILLTSLAASIYILSYAKGFETKNMMDMYKTIGVLLLVLIALAGIIQMLGTIDAVSAIAGAIAMGTLLMAIAGALWIVSYSGTFQPGEIAKTVGILIELAVIVVLLGEVIKGMNGIDAGKAIGNAIALGVLLTAVAGAMWIVSMSAALQPGQLLNIVTILGTLTVVVWGLSLIITSMDGLNPFKAIVNAQALSTLLLAMSASMLILSLCNPMGIAAIGALAHLTAAVAGLAAVLGILDALNVAPSIETAAALSVLLLGMSASLVILGVVGAMGPAAHVGITALVELIVVFGVLLTLLAGLCALIPGAEEFLAKGVPVIETIGRAIGGFVGGILGGIAEGATSALPQIGKHLTDFYTNAEGFITGISGIKEDMKTGAKNLAGAVLALIGAEFISTYATAFTGGACSLGSLGKDLSKFMTNLSPFLASLEAVNANSVKKAGIIGDTMLALSQAQLADSINNLIPSFARSDMSTMGTKLSQFGLAMAAFDDALKGHTFDEATINAAKTAAETMSELQKGIDPIGGVAGFFCGERDLGNFGTQLEHFGTGLAKFSDAVKGDKVDSDAIGIAAKAGTKMADLQAAIEPTKGLLQFFTGTKGLDTFGSDLAAYGASLVKFCTSIAGLDETALTNIENAKTAGTLMGDLQKTLPEDKWLDGKANLEQFGQKMSGYGTYIKAYATKVAEIDPTSFNASLSYAETLVKIAKSVVDIDPDAVSNFEKIKIIGSSIKDYYGNIESVEPSQLAESIIRAEQLRDFVKSLVGFDPSGADSFKQALADLASADANGIVTAFETSIETLTTIGSDIITAIINGINAKKEELTLVIGDVASGMLTGFTVSNSDYVDAGRNFMSNLKSGIEGQESTFTASVASIASAGATAAENKYKKYYDAGKYLVKKFASGITAGYNSKSSDIKEIGSKAIGKITDGISGKEYALRTSGKEIAKALCTGFETKKSDFSKCGKDFVTKIKDGIEDNASKTKKAAGNMAKDSKDKVREYYDSFYNAGSHLVNGFRNGISDNTWKAEAKSRAMAKKARDAAEDELGVQSPSRVFYGIGEYVVAGFVNALSDGERSTANAAISMADTAKTGFSDAIGRVSDYLSGNMDAQPTIRPVLDLSDVESGASTIGSMFGNPSLGVMSNFGAISNTMNSRNQNSTNDDVVNAINRLRGVVGNLENTSYNINGITYDDGSGVSDAIRTLVRAVKVEGRA